MTMSPGANSRVAGVEELLSRPEGQLVASGQGEDVAADLVRVSAVGARVVGVLRPAGDRDVVQRAVPGVLELEVEPVGIALDGFDLQLVEDRIAPARQNQDVRPRLVRPVGLEGAGNLLPREVDRVVVPGQVRAVVAHVRRAQPEVRAHLPLQRQVPLVALAVADVLLDRRQAGVRRNGAPAGERRGQGDGGGVAGRRLEGLAQQERRVIETALPEPDVDGQEIEVHAGAAADHGARVAERPPGETGARPEVVPVGRDVVHRHAGLRGQHDRVSPHQPLLRL